MGLFDKAKGFFGGKNMASVTIPVIERQPTENASFPVRDSVLKGTMLITANEPCTVLATKYEISLRVVEEGINIDHYVVSAKDPAPNTDYSLMPFQFPYEMKAGETLEQGFIVMDVDLPKVLAENGHADPDAATTKPNISLVVKCIADVKGSPFDPSHEVQIRLAPGGG